MAGHRPRPWAAAAAAVLRELAPHLHPLQVLAVMACSTREHAMEGRLTHVPEQHARVPVGPLRWLGRALASAGTLVYVRDPPPGVRVPHVDALEVWLRSRQDPRDVAQVCALLGWPREGAPLLFAQGRVQVREARRLLVGDAVQARRQQVWQGYVRQARQGQRRPGLAPGMLGLVRSAWRAPVDGRIQEVFC